MPPFFQSAIAKPPQRQLSHDLLLQPNQPAKGSQAALLNASPLRCVNVVGLDPRVSSLFEKIFANKMGCRVTPGTTTLCRFNKGGK
jgi:hypothetical protein